MKIALAQIRPQQGDIKKNVNLHHAVLAKAVSYQCSLVLFPELSLTGYEPGLAKSLALKIDDLCLMIFRTSATATKW